MDVLVDSNVLLDVLTLDANWFDWSSRTLAHYLDDHRLVVNPIIYAEVSVGFDRVEDLEEVLSDAMIGKTDVPYSAAFLAGKCFRHYRRRGGTKKNPLPDFFIGAHAAVAEMPLISRDCSRFRSYFPTVRLISPPSG